MFHNYTLNLLSYLSVVCLGVVFKPKSEVQN